MKHGFVLIWLVAICFSKTAASAWNEQERVEIDAVGDPVSELGKNLMLVYQDSKGDYWFATWGDGLYRFDGKSIVHFTTKHGLAHNRTDEIVEDDAGNLYFNTSNGVSRFDGKMFSTLPVSVVSEWHLETKDLWFKSPQFSGKVYRFDGKMLHELQMPRTKMVEDFIAKNPGSASPYAVYSIYRDSHGNVWFGTGASGVCRYDGNSIDWINGNDVNELHHGPSNGIRSMIEDREGLFWFNTLFRYRIQDRRIAAEDQRKENNFFSRLAGIGSLDGKPNGDFHEYMSIAKDNQGDLWMATYGGGVYRFDGVKLKHYPIMDGPQVVTLFSIYRDKDGILWLGTHEHGAYRLDQDRFVRFRPLTP